MRIIIDGADMTGKSTLIKQLQEHYKETKGIELGTIHNTSTDLNTFEYFKDTLETPNTIFDRHIVGEMIYPQYFERERGMSFDEFETLLSKARLEKVPILILTIEPLEMFKRSYDRPDEPEQVINNWFEIDKKFRAMADLFEIKVINTSDHTLHEIVELIELQYSEELQ